MIYFIVIGVSLLASIVGSICGIGGGVVIKPILDATGILPVTTISFLSGCTVLSMAIISLIKSSQPHEGQTFDRYFATVLGLGSAVGGILGKYLYQHIISGMPNTNLIGSVQASLLLLLTLGTLIYTLNKAKIVSKQISNKSFTFMIGIILGIFSAFLGIGGGPFNLIVLFYFFSMRTKQAAIYSLYCIAFSQITSLISTLIQNNMPVFDIEILILMACAGIAGGLVGSKLNRFLSEHHVDRLFMILTSVIAVINTYNIFKYINL